MLETVLMTYGLAKAQCEALAPGPPTQQISQQTAAQSVLARAMLHRLARSRASHIVSNSARRCTFQESPTAKQS